jgi:hypothetical protein
VCASVTAASEIARKLAVFYAYRLYASFALLLTSFDMWFLEHRKQVLFHERRRTPLSSESPAKPHLFKRRFWSDEQSNARMV